jgi:hypothetical protein
MNGGYGTYTFKRSDLMFLEGFSSPREVNETRTLLARLRSDEVAVSLFRCLAD